MVSRVGNVTLVLKDKASKRDIASLERRLGSALANTTFKVAEETRKVARQLVPKDTRATMDGIMTVVKVRDRNFVSIKVGFETNPHPEKTWSGGEFELPAWMTFSRKAITGWPAYGHGHLVFFKDGNPRFLLIAAGYAKTRFGKAVEARTGHIIKG